VVGVVSALAAASAGASTVFRTFVAPVTGNDANDCSRAAPCLTLQRALNQVQAHGTVTVLESGVLGQGATVSKAVTVNVPAGIDAGLSRSTGTLLIVNAPTSAVVTINGLTLDGRGTADIGIFYTSGLALYLNRVQITDFGTNATEGIRASANDNVHLKLNFDHSFISGTRTAIFPVAFTNASVIIGLENSRLRGNSEGVFIQNGVRAHIVRSVISGDGTGGGVQGEGSGQAMISDSTFEDNDVGLDATNGTAIWVTHSMISGNNTGLVRNTGGAIYTGGDNILVGNTTDGTFTGPIPLK